MKIRHAVLAILAAAVLLPATVSAAGHWGHGPMGPGGEHGFMGMDGGMVLRLADKLGLSDAQVTQIKGIVSAARTANQGTRDQIKANRQAFVAAYNPAQFDATAVNNYIAQQTPLVQQLVVSRFQTQASVLAVLTPAQLAQYNQIRAKFAARMQSGGGRP